MGGVQLQKSASKVNKTGVKNVHKKNFEKTEEAPKSEKHK